MSNRYSLSQTCNPRPTYRVIDHTFDDEIAWGTSARRLLDVLNRRDAF